MFSEPEHNSSTSVDKDEIPEECIQSEIDLDKYNPNQIKSLFDSDSEEDDEDINVLDDTDDEENFVNDSSTMINSGDDNNSICHVNDEGLTDDEDSSIDSLGISYMKKSSVIDPSDESSSDTNDEVELSDYIPSDADDSSQSTLESGKMTRSKNSLSRPKHILILQNKETPRLRTSRRSVSKRKSNSNSSEMIPSSFVEVKDRLAEQDKDYFNNISTKEALAFFAKQPHLYRPNSRSGINKIDVAWFKKFKKLLEFKEQHGHCFVPLIYPQDQELAVWARHQRYIHNNTQLANTKPEYSERFKCLEYIGFEWNPNKTINDARWDMRFNQLLEFKKQHGHTDVPHGYKPNVKLATWVGLQRGRFYNDGKPNQLGIPKERVKRLKQIGFNFCDPQEKENNERWEQRFQELVEYKKQHGNTTIKCKNKSHPKLGPWVKSQRELIRTNKLSKERVERIMKLDKNFIDRPTIFMEKWINQYNKILKFKEEHGHSKVPHTYKKTSSMYKWTLKQRHDYIKYRSGKESFMNPEKLKYLEKLDLEWFHG